MDDPCKINYLFAMLAASEIDVELDRALQSTPVVKIIAMQLNFSACRLTVE